ncbi:hypothetical protein [Polaribacter aestuariivivens]|uniref:hypothetical protein n=1 Tax=Polaribacter aestuariivivens TaxID=2304626 RepID=UPI003F492BA8
MKKIITLTFVIVFLYRCEKPVKISDRKTISKTAESTTSILKIEGCEYVFYTSTSGAALTHKGNCSNNTHKP